MSNSVILIIETGTRAVQSIETGAIITVQYSGKNRRFFENI